MYVDYPVEQGRAFPGTSFDEFENPTRLRQVVFEDANDDRKRDCQCDLHVAVRAVAFLHARQSPGPDEQRQDYDERERYYVDEYIGTCTEEAGWKHGIASGVG